jgi:hypothetical protein
MSARGSVIGKPGSRLPVRDKVLAITSDNRIEFVHHETIAKDLDADFFFADPYSSWQRGTNENTNGLMREYFPKRTDFATVPDRNIERWGRELSKHCPIKSRPMRKKWAVQTFAHFVVPSRGWSKIMRTCSSLIERYSIRCDSPTRRIVGRRADFQARGGI